MDTLKGILNVLIDNTDSALSELHAFDIDYAVLAIKKLVREKMPSQRELIEERLMLIDPRYAQQTFNKGFNHYHDQMEKEVDNL